MLEYERGKKRGVWLVTYFLGEVEEEGGFGQLAAEEGLDVLNFKLALSPENL